MSEWEKTRLGDVGRVVTGTTPPTKHPEYFGDDYRFVTPSDLTYDTFYVNVTERGLSQTGYATFVKRCIPKNSTMFTCIASIGKIGLSKATVLTNQQINSIVPSSESNPVFVYYWLKHYAKSIGAQYSGCAVPIINKQAFENIELPFPPRPIQDRIAGILSDYDSAIANCRKQIALLEEAAMRLYREWFKDGKGEMKRIEDICKKIGSGGTPSRRNENFWDGGKIPWVKTGELQDCWIFDTEEKITAEGLSGSSAKMFPAETLMMAIYASPTLGRLGILDMPACCNQATLCLIADETVVSWQWLYCKLYELRDKFNAIARGAGQQNISGIVVKEYSVVVPERRKVESFTTTVASMFQQMRVMGKQIRTLTEARDRLLPKLMKGEIAV